MKTTIKNIIENAFNDNDNYNSNNAQMIRAIYWYAHSLGQEDAESKIRLNLKTLPQHRYHRLQRETVAHVLQDNPCAVRAPFLPDFEEIGEWEFIDLDEQNNDPKIVFSGRDCAVSRPCGCITNHRLGDGKGGLTSPSRIKFARRLTTVNCPNCQPDAQTKKPSCEG